MEEIHIIQQTHTALPLLIQGCFLPASRMLLTSFPFSKAQTLSVLSLEAVTIRVSSQSTALTPEQKNRTRLHEKKLVASLSWLEHLPKITILSHFSKGESPMYLRKRQFTVTY